MKITLMTLMMKFLENEKYFFIKVYAINIYFTIAYE